MRGFLRIFSAILDAILPRRERTVRSETYSLADIPLSPMTHELLGARILTIMDYREPAVEDVIRSLKYDRGTYARKLLAEILADYLREEISSVRSFSARRVVLVPIPLHKERQRERGFNQIEAVLNALPEEFRNGALSYMEVKSFLRVRATKQQTHLSRKERLRNVSGAFMLSAPDSVRDAHVFLIDDVVTTGATLAEAARPLMENAASVTLLALARA